MNSQQASSNTADMQVSSFNWKWNITTRQIQTGGNIVAVDVREAVELVLSLAACSDDTYSGQLGVSANELLGELGEPSEDAVYTYLPIPDGTLSLEKLTSTTQAEHEEFVRKQGPAPWAYIITVNAERTHGEVLAVDPRDALSRTLTSVNAEGVMYGKALGLSADVLHDAPANAVEEYAIDVPGGTLVVKKVTTPLFKRLEMVEEYLRTENRLKVSIDYAYTRKYGQVNILCAAVYEETIREACIKHLVAIASMHTYE